MATDTDRNLFSVFFRTMEQPDRPVVASMDGTLCTYGQLIDRTGQVANVLVGLGVKPGDRVIAVTDKSVTALVLFLATLRAGAIYLPLNPAYTLNELDYFVTDAEPSVVVCDPAMEVELKKIVSKVNGVVETMDSDGAGSLSAAADGAACAFETIMREDDDLAAILYTSGTTGRPKGAMLSHKNIVANSYALATLWKFTGQDNLILAVPLFHGHGLFSACTVALCAQATMTFLPKFDADQIIELMDRATVLSGVPTFYTRLMQHPDLDRAAIKRMRLFISSSAPLLPETHEEWFERTGHKVLERIGMTEANATASNPLEGERKPGSVGLPVPGVSVRVCDPETGEQLATGEIGMIEVSGPNVFKGYWKMPEKSAGEFRDDGYFITGDLGRIDEDGYVYIVGRNKDLVISGGYNVYPKEVESELNALPGVVESAVIGVPHADFGEGVTAIVVAKPGAELNESNIQVSLSGLLAKYKIPKRIFIVDELPRNTMGKVQKNILRDTYKETFANA